MSRKAAKPELSKPETDVELQAMSKAELADAFGPLASALKPLDKRAAAFKREFERRGVAVLVGEKFVVAKSESSFPGISIAKAKAALGAAWCEANKEPVVRVSWRATPLGEADKAEVEAA